MPGDVIIRTGSSGDVSCSYNRFKLMASGSKLGKPRREFELISRKILTCDTEQCARKMMHGALEAIWSQGLYNEHQLELLELASDFRRKLRLTLECR